MRKKPVGLINQNDPVDIQYPPVTTGFPTFRYHQLVNLKSLTFSSGQ